MRKAVSRNTHCMALQRECLLPRTCTL